MQKIIFSFLLFALILPAGLVAYGSSGARGELVVVAPNGEEVLNKNQKHLIYWKTTITPIKPTSVPFVDRILNAARFETDVVPSPYYPLVSIDLIRDSDPSFRHHIARVSIFDSQYTWVVPQLVADGQDYRIQISVDLPWWGLQTVTDSSDKPFSIIGGSCISQETIVKIKNKIGELERELQELRRLVDVL